MKAKIGNIEIEGTPEEIKEFVNSQQLNDVKEARGSSNLPKMGLSASNFSSADNIHTQIKKEVDKDYPTPMSEEGRKRLLEIGKCVKSVNSESEDKR